MPERLTPARLAEIRAWVSTAIARRSTIATRDLLAHIEALEGELATARAIAYRAGREDGERLKAIEARSTDAS